MEKIILYLLIGMFIGRAISGARKLAKIRQLKRELEDFQTNHDHDFLDHAARTHGKMADLALWESFVEKVSENGFMEFPSDEITVPGKAAEMLDFWRSKNESQQKLLDDANKLICEIYGGREPNVKVWLEKYHAQKGD